jgi:hypothetical protein
MSISGINGAREWGSYGDDGNRQAGLDCSSLFSVSVFEDASASGLQVVGSVEVLKVKRFDQQGSCKNRLVLCVLVLVKTEKANPKTASNSVEFAQIRTHLSEAINNACSTRAS